MSKEPRSPTISACRGPFGQPTAAVSVGWLYLSFIEFPLEGAISPSP